MPFDRAIAHTKMAKDRNGNSEDINGVSPSNKRDRLKYDSKPDPDSDSESDKEPRKSEGSRKRTKKKNKTRSSSSKRKRSRDDDSYSSLTDYDDSSDSESESESESGSSYYSDSEEERRRRRKERKRREEKKERRRREKEKDKKRKRKEGEKKKLKKKKDKKKEKGKKGAVTNSWGKYGIIRETDMWNKRPEFTAWLAEVKQVNLESLPNWEEKQMFKQFMEDHNTATFPSKKYYDLDAYHRHEIEKEIKRGIKKLPDKERTVFNDEEQRRQELMREREKQKQAQVEALKQEMQSGMAQAMKDQSRLKEEMAYQYKLGNFEAAAAIQRRLDPDVAM